MADPLEIQSFIPTGIARGTAKALLTTNEAGIVQISMLEKSTSMLLSMNVREDDVVRMHEWLDRVIELYRREGRIRPEREEAWRNSLS
jgi:hypothetical protein